MTCVYLSGPIYGCTDDEAVTWRENVKVILERKGYAYKDPMIRDFRGHEDVQYKYIVEKDLTEIAESDIILVNWIKPSVGTSMELVYAKILGKEIIVVAPPNISHVPAWLLYHASILVHSTVEKVAETL